MQRNQPLRVIGSLLIAGLLMSTAQAGVVSVIGFNRPSEVLAGIYQEAGFTVIPVSGDIKITNTNGAFGFDRGTLEIPGHIRVTIDDQTPFSIDRLVFGSNVSRTGRSITLQGTKTDGTLTREATTGQQSSATSFDDLVGFDNLQSLSIRGSGGLANSVIDNLTLTSAGPAPASGISYAFVGDPLGFGRSDPVYRQSGSITLRDDFFASGIGGPLPVTQSDIIGLRVTGTRSDGNTFTVDTTDGSGASVGFVRNLFATESNIFLRQVNQPSDESQIDVLRNNRQVASWLRTDNSATPSSYRQAFLENARVAGLFYEDTFPQNPFQGDDWVLASRSGETPVVPEPSTVFSFVFMMIAIGLGAFRRRLSILLERQPVLVG